MCFETIVCCSGLCWQVTYRHEAGFTFSLPAALPAAWDSDVKPSHLQWSGFGSEAATIIIALPPIRMTIILTLKIYERADLRLAYHSRVKAGPAKGWTPEKAGHFRERR